MSNADLLTIILCSMLGGGVSHLVMSAAQYDIRKQRLIVVVLAMLILFALMAGK